eukprot:15457561-Alexandrium_andersonii.AAC.1
MLRVKRLVRSKHDKRSKQAIQRAPRLHDEKATHTLRGLVKIGAPWIMLALTSSLLALGTPPSSSFIETFAGDREVTKAFRRRGILAAQRSVAICLLLCASLRSPQPKQHAAIITACAMREGSDSS